MNATEPRSYHWEHDADTNSWHAVDNPFRIVAAVSLDENLRPLDVPWPGMNVASPEEIDLFNDGSYCELVGIDPSQQLPEGWDAVALIGPDEDGATYWLVRTEGV